MGYARRNFLVPVPTIDDFDEFNKLLFERCEADAQREHYTKGKTVSVLWEEEKAKLLCLPAYEYQVFRYEVVKLNQYGQATIETNRYGLSPAFAHQKAQAKIFHDKIELYIDHQLLKTYPRCYGRNQEMLDWRQYLGALLVKPRAVEHTRFFNQIPHGWQHLLRDTQGKERKSALCLLQEIVTDGNENICNDIIEMAKDCGRTDSSSLCQKIIGHFTTSAPLTENVTRHGRQNWAATPFSSLLRCWSPMPVKNKLIAPVWASCAFRRSTELNAWNMPVVKL